MFVFAVGITMRVIVSMLGAVVGDLEPGITFAVSLLDPLIWNSSGRLRGDSWAGANGISRLQCLLQLIDL